MFDSSSLYLLPHLKINIDKVSPGSPKTQCMKQGLKKTTFAKGERKEKWDGCITKEKKNELDDRMWKKVARIWKKNYKDRS